MGASTSQPCGPPLPVTGIAFHFFFFTVDSRTAGLWVRIPLYELIYFRILAFVGRGLAMATLSPKDSHWMFIGFTLSEVSPEVIQATGANP
jgi:hypothetical protein